MWESLYCSQDFVVAKGLFSHLKNELPEYRRELSCQNVEGYITGLHLQQYMHYHSHFKGPECQPIRIQL